MKREVNIMDLFSGIGGFSLGIKQAGFKINKHYFSEIDKHAIANYKYNFKNAKYIGSVTDIRGERGQADIITFGSPCQDFSLAGQRKGLDGNRSSLILEAIRLISEVKPSVFVWENVKGTFSSNNGKDFWAILNAFANIGGYRLEWQLLNTSWFLPQNRERIYLVGHLAGRSKLGVFPIQENDGLSNKANRTKQGRTQAENSTTITENNGSKATDTFIKVTQPKILQTPRGKNNGGLSDNCPTISSCSFENNNHVVIKSNTKKGYEVMTEDDSLNLSVPKSKTRRGRVGKGVAQTLDTQCNQGVMLSEPRHKHGDDRVYKNIAPTVQSRYGTGGDNIPYVNNIRRLTEIEVERLQGFPDNWTKYGNYDGVIKEISKTQRYKMVGNAVTVKVVEEVYKRIELI